MMELELDGVSRADADPGALTVRGQLWVFTHSGNEPSCAASPSWRAWNVSAGQAPAGFWFSFVCPSPIFLPICVAKCECRAGQDIPQSI